MMKKKTIIDRDLQEIVSVIRRINPHKIFLFGSRVGTNIHEGSDIDLLVVVPSNDRPLDRRLKLRKMLREYDRRFGLDLLVYTPDEFDTFKNDPSSFVYSAIKRGMKLYDNEAH